MAWSYLPQVSRSPTDVSVLRSQNVIVQILGDAGRHARAAVGMGGLPGDVSIEVEAIVEITPQ